MDKAGLHAELLDALRRALDQVAAAQRATQQGVTHEDARSEGDKDMRATEASYVARGQAMRVEALEGELARVAAMRLVAFGAQDPIALSAVVTLETDAGTRRLLLAPGGGGIRLASAGGEVHVVTPSSPLGRALVGARAGDVVVYERGSTEEEVEITAVV